MKCESYLQKKADLVDPTCTKWPPGTLQKWFCLKTVEEHWNYEQCFKNGMQRGFTPKQILKALKKITTIPESAEAAFRQGMFEGIIPFPKWMIRTAWYDYVDTCSMMGKEYTSRSSMSSWIDKYFCDPKYYIKPNYKVKNMLLSEFQGFVRNPPRKPLITRWLELFNTYGTEDFAVRK